MNRQELNDDMNSQAQTALAYLEHTRALTIGGEDNVLKRELTKDEENVKDSALTCLMGYFEKDLEGVLTTIFKTKVNIPEVKKQIKKQCIKTSKSKQK